MTKLRTLVCIVVSLLLMLVPVAMGQERVEISLWHHWDAHRLELLQGILDEFQAEYPWIHVNSLVSSTAGAQDRMGTLLLSGAAPEVMMVRGTYAFTFMSVGGFMSLDDLLARDGLDLAMYNEGDLRTFQLLGKTYGLPFMSGGAWTNLMFYNKEMMIRGGLDPDSPATTWTEWRIGARTMTRIDDNGIVYEGGTNLPGSADVGAWNGAAYWTDDWRRATIDTPAFHDTLDFLEQLLADTYVTTAAASAFAQATCWAGSTGYCFANNSGFSHATASGFDWGVALAPVNERNPDAKPTGLVSSSWAYGIPGTIEPDKLEAAWLLVKWLAADERGAGAFARMQGRPSPVIEFNRHPDYIWDNPYWPVVVQAVQHDVPVPPGNAVALVTAGGSSVLAGTAHRQQALADANLRLQTALDEYWLAVGQ